MLPGLLLLQPISAPFFPRKVPTNPGQKNTAKQARTILITPITTARNRWGVGVGVGVGVGRASLFFLQSCQIQTRPCFCTSTEGPRQNCKVHKESVPQASRFAFLYVGCPLSNLQVFVTFFCSILLLLLVTQALIATQNIISPKHVSILVIIKISG